jgi:hypothetical protein
MAPRAGAMCSDPYATSLKFMKRTRPLLLVPLLAAAAACTAPATGSATPTGGARPSGSSDTQRELAGWKEVAKCYRQHGVPNFPDPVVGSNGEVQVPGMQVPAAAKTACAPIMRQLAGTKSLPSYSPAQMDQLRKLAQCFRAHGVADWPDPDSNGIFQINERLRQLGKRAWLPAREACKQYFVGKSIITGAK